MAAGLIPVNAGSHQCGGRRPHRRPVEREPVRPLSDTKWNEHMSSSPSLWGPYLLTKENIQSIVVGVGPGVYALGDVDGSSLRVFRVGRSDLGLAQRLTDYIGQYRAFMYGFCSSALDAFNAECSLYHTHHPRDHSIHPDRPSGMQIPCLYCSVFNRPNIVGFGFGLSGFRP